MKLYLKYTTLVSLKIFLVITGTLVLTATAVQMMMFLSVSMNSLDLGLASMIKFMLLSLPSIFVYVSPIALICMVLYYFHILFLDNELLILELSGLSKHHIVLPVLSIMCATALLSLVVCCFINPICKKQLLRQRETLHKNVINAILKEKTFAKISDKLILYIEKRQSDKSLKGVIIYDKTNPTEVTTIFAKKGTLLDEDDKTVFKLHDGSRQTLTKNKLQTLYFKSLIFDVSEYARKFKDVRRLLDSQSIHKLITLRRIQNKDLSFRKKIEQEIHRRVSWSLLNISLPILFLFSGLSYREYRTKSINKLSIGISVSLSILSMVLYFCFINRIDTRINFVVLTYVNILFFCGVGVFLLRSVCKPKILLQ